MRKTNKQLQEENDLYRDELEKQKREVNFMHRRINELTADNNFVKTLQEATNTELVACREANKSLINSVLKLVSKL